MCLLPETAQRIGLMLGLPDDDLVNGAEVPAGWHFPLIGCETPTAQLREDGFPGLGLPLPELGLPRIVAGGRTLTCSRPIRIGVPLVRTSVVSALRQGEGAAGPFAILTVVHELQEPGLRHTAPAVREEQTYVFLASPYAARPGEGVPETAGLREVGAVTPDQTMLFQFSALSFNSHKIHLDRDYARDVEHYPDLVVNGGITTLLMAEIFRREVGRPIASLSVTNKAPLFCGRQITFLMQDSADGHRIFAHDEGGHIAAEMDVFTRGL